VVVVSGRKEAKRKWREKAGYLSSSSLLKDFFPGEPTPKNNSLILKLQTIPITGGRPASTNYIVLQEMGFKVEK